MSEKKKEVPKHLHFPEDIVGSLEFPSFLYPFLREFLEDLTINRIFFDLENRDIIFYRDEGSLRIETAVDKGVIVEQSLFAKNLSVDVDAGIGGKLTVTGDVVAGYLFSGGNLDVTGNITGAYLGIGGEIWAVSTISTEWEFRNWHAGGGLIVKTPDGTANYRIRVDNQGNIVTELL